MSTEVMIAIIGLASAALGVIGQIVIAVINRPAEAKTPPRNRFGWLAAVFVIVGVLLVGWYILFQVMPALDDPLAFENTTRRFDCETVRGWETVLVFDDAWQALTPPDFAPDARPVPIQTTGNHLCGYDLPVNDTGVRHFTVTYPEPVRAGLVTARFWLPESGGKLAFAQAVLVALDADPAAPAFGPRLAESVVPLREGAWTLAVLDLRDRRDFSGKLIADGVFLVQVVISLEGAADVSAETVVTAGFDDLLLFDDAGGSALRYASAGLSAFITPRPLSLDAQDYRWSGSADPRYQQETSPQLARAAVGGVVGTFLTYPVRLRTRAVVDEGGSRNNEGIQEAAFERELRPEERANLDTVLVTAYVAADSARNVVYYPVLQLNDGRWVTGFGQTIPTNQWVTLTWRGVIDSTNYSQTFIEALMSLRDASGIPDAGGIRLVHHLWPNSVQQLRLVFRMDSALESGVEDAIDATIYIGDVTFLP